MANVQSIRQTQYWMNPNYALKVREDLVKLLDASLSTLSKQHGKNIKEPW